MPNQVLIVEDDDALRFVYELSLSRIADLTLVSVPDGETALAYLRDNTPQMIILDILLPRLSGEAVLNFIYSAPHLRTARVFVVTAHESYQQLPLRPGDRFFLKPLINGTLRHAVQAALTPATS